MYRRAYHKGKGRALSGRSPNTMYLRTMRGRFVFPLVLMLLSQVLAAQLPMPELSAGTLIRIDSFASSYVDARPVDIWLPPGYETTQQYPVLYMQDGQMLFDARTTWNKQEWGMDEVIPALIDSGQIQAFILVAVWNNAPVRYLEYTSMKPFVYFSDSDMAILRDEPATGRLFTGDNLKGDLYLRFLVSELKPYIDSHYPTLSGREDTFIMGSSFGGLISMFAICEYPEVFGGAACLSTHWTGLYRQENNPFPLLCWHILKITCLIHPPTNCISITAPQHWTASMRHTSNPLIRSCGKGDTLLPTAFHWSLKVHRIRKKPGMTGCIFRSLSCLARVMITDAGKDRSLVVLPIA